MRRVLFLGPLLLACNPTAGFQDAAAAINPAEKSYLETPAAQLTAGPYETVGVDVDLDTNVHLLARRRDQTDTLNLFGQDAQHGCQITPDTLTWFVPRPAEAPSRLLPYFETRNGQGVGRLRFTSLDCQLDPMIIDNARDPYGIDVKSGFLVPIGASMAVVDPWHSTTRTLLNQYYGLVQFSSPLILWGDDQFVSYDADLNELGRYGTKIVSAAVSGSDGAIGLQETFQNPDQTTTNRLERITPPDDPTAPLVLETVLDDACNMWGVDMYSTGWVLVHSPCGASNVSAVYLGSSPLTSPVPTRLSVFNTVVDTWNARVATNTTNGKANDLTLFYVQDVDPATNLGTLYATRQADAAPIKIGEHASLNLVKLLPTGSWAGTAIVDAANGLASWVQWSWDPTVTPQVLASNVYFDGSYSQVIANYDGTSGDSMIWSSNGAVVREHGVPPINTHESALSYPYDAHLENFDGTTGDLLVAQSGGSGVPLGVRVPLNSYHFLDAIPMPGIAYLTSWDKSARTGTLVAQNLRLGAQTTIANGVSAFTATGYPVPGILFAIPEGSSAGLWFAQAK